MKSPHHTLRLVGVFVAVMAVVYVPTTIAVWAYEEGLWPALAAVAVLVAVIAAILVRKKTGWGT